MLRIKPRNKCSLVSSIHAQNSFCWCNHESGLDKFKLGHPYILQKRVICQLSSKHTWEYTNHPEHQNNLCQRDLQGHKGSPKIYKFKIWKSQNISHWRITFSFIPLLYVRFFSAILYHSHSSILPIYMFNCTCAWWRETYWWLCQGAQGWMDRVGPRYQPMAGVKIRAHERSQVRLSPRMASCWWAVLHGFWAGPKHQHQTSGEVLSQTPCLARGILTQMWLWIDLLQGIFFKV